MSVHSLSALVFVFACVSGGVDTAAGGKEEDQEGLQTSPAHFTLKPRPQQHTL